MKLLSLCLYESTTSCSCSRVVRGEATAPSSSPSELISTVHYFSIWRKKSTIKVTTNIIIGIITVIFNVIITNLLKSSLSFRQNFQECVFP